MSNDYIHPLSINGQLMEKDARIAELEAALDDMHKGHDAICKYVSELEAALTPLAEMDYWIEPHHDAHDSIEQCNQLTVAEVRAARAALNGEK